MQFPKPLKNTYFALRHGQSTSNTQDIIVSDPEIGTSDFPLTEVGRNQVEQSMRNSALINTPVILYHSPFLRTVQTADIAQQLLSIEKRIQTDALLERYFGENDGKKGALEYYAALWQKDTQDTAANHFDAESVDAVLQRLTDLVCECEAQYEGKTILFVSHGDPLNILQTAFMGIAPNQHSTAFSTIDKGEIRKFSA